MPRQPFTRSRTLPISPGDSPSRIAGCHRRYRNRHSASLRVSHVCAELTVEQNAATRNRKTFRPCEEAVDDETLLWRAEENGKEIAPGADSRAHHSSSLISSDESPWRSLECRRCDPSQSPTRAAINPTRPCTLPISTGCIWLCSEIDFIPTILFSGMMYHTSSNTADAARKSNRSRMTSVMFGIDCLSPSRGLISKQNPGLAPWAAFLRRFAALDGREGRPHMDFASLSPHP
jgi:hypothetical protein